MKLSDRKAQSIVYISFAIFFVMGLLLVKDYGATWDEFNHFDFGYRWYKYSYGVLINGDSLIPAHMETQADIIHGPLIEMLYAFLADKIFNFKDSHKIILLRHYCSWLVFYIGVIFFYLLCKHHFRSRLFALLGCSLLVLHPRIFAHSFYNSMDIALLSFFIISLFTLLKHIELKTLKTSVFHALACSILLDIRVIGVVIPLLTYVLYFWDILEPKSNKAKRLAATKSILFFSVFLFLFVILFWPYLWRNPLAGIIEIIRQTPKILMGITVLYLGDYIKATQIPWHYILVWIGITTPIVYSLFFSIGFVFVLENLFRKSRWPSYQTKVHLLFLFSFLIPIILVTTLNAVLYDAWRHLFFIYPAFVLIVLIGINQSYSVITIYSQGFTRTCLKAAIILPLMISMAITGNFIIKNHPFQNIYFNRLAGNDMKTIKNRFELDYWGLSYRKGIEFILSNDNRKNIKIFDAIAPGPLPNTIKFMPKKARMRLTQVWSPTDADYVITNYRWHKEDYPFHSEPFSIEIGNAKIMSIFQLTQ